MNHNEVSGATAKSFRGVHFFGSGRWHQEFPWRGRYGKKAVGMSAFPNLRPKGFGTGVAQVLVIKLGALLPFEGSVRWLEYKSTVALSVLVTRLVRTRMSVFCSDFVPGFSASTGNNQPMVSMGSLSVAVSAISYWQSQYRYHH